MTKLDETATAAARLALIRSTGSDPLLDALTAYLDATHTSDALRDLQRLGQECETLDVRAALQRLVELKDGPRDAVYSCTKAAVWQAARDALAHNPIPKGEGDRLAVVVNEAGEAAGYTVRTDKPWWGIIEAAEAHDMQGPFRRQIVTIPGGLLRPEPVAEVVGWVKDA